MFSEKMVDAFRFAAASHRKQKRKGSETPYIAHPMAVASLVLEHGGGEDVFCAALLHDTIEDCGVKPLTLSEMFGQHVLDIVLAVTNPPIDWKSFKSDEELQVTLRAFRMVNFEKLREAPADVLLLSACDKLHNARGILEDLRKADASGLREPVKDHAALIHKVWDRFRGKREGTIWYYAGISQVYCDSEFPQVKILGYALFDVVQRMNSSY